VQWPQAWQARSDKPQESVKSKYENSNLITAKLTDQIYNQKLDLDYNPFDQQYPRTIKSKIRQQKDTTYRNRRDALFEELHGP